MNKAEKTAVIGMVNTHAHTMLLATPHFTLFNLREAPTPIIVVVIIWVVLTGALKNVAHKITSAAPVCAAKPFTGVSFVIPLPMVLIIFLPPIEVPIAIARAQENKYVKFRQ